MTPIMNQASLRSGFQSRFLPRRMTIAELHRNIDRLPSGKMVEWGAKIYLLCNLTWGYVETVMQVCRTLRIEATKPLSRKVRELKREYDQFRCKTLGDIETAEETRMGEWFEDQFTADFDRLFTGIDNEANKYGSIRLYVVALHQALTLIEAVKRYARSVDAEVKEYGAWTCDCCMLQTQFLDMHSELKKFPTAGEERFAPMRELSARILENRLHSLEVGTDENNKVWIKKKQN